MTEHTRGEDFSNLKAGDVIAADDLYEILIKSAQNKSRHDQKAKEFEISHDSISDNVPSLPTDVSLPQSETKLFLITSDVCEGTGFGYRINWSLFSSNICQILKNGEPDMDNQIKVEYANADRSIDEYDGPKLFIIGQMQPWFKWDRVPLGFNFGNKATAKTPTAPEPTT